jgi:cytidine deaminase
MRVDASELLARAVEAAGRAYAPYSRFPVGAALLCGDGSVVTGTNVENRSFGLTVCAERTAIHWAVAQGKRDFQAIAVSCPQAAYAVAPCGACRQVLSEFCAPEMPVIFAGGDGQPVTVSLGELLPRDSLHELGQRKEERG